MTQKYTAQSIRREETERKKKTVTPGIWTGTRMGKDKHGSNLINDICEKDSYNTHTYT